MLGAIKYNLANLFNVSGRDARQTFWYYVLAIVVLHIAASMAISIPMMATAMASAFEAANAAADDCQNDRGHGEYGLVFDRHRHSFGHAPFLGHCAATSRQ
jgi:uncharacterized membrane protein YhaH (DUF805 family)